MNSPLSLPPLHTTRFLVQAWPWLWICSDLSISPSKCHQKLNLVLGISLEKCRWCTWGLVVMITYILVLPLWDQNKLKRHQNQTDGNQYSLSVTEEAGWGHTDSRALRIPCWHTTVSSSSLLVVAALICWSSDELMINIFWISALEFTQLQLQAPFLCRVLCPDAYDAQ